MYHVPYVIVVGRLMHAMVCTRLDITHEVVVLNKYISKLGKEHCIAVKMVFKYLCGTLDHAICYQGKGGLDKELDIYGFVHVV